MKVRIRMIFLTLVFSTFREAFAKKIFLGFFVISTLIILLELFAVNVESVEGIMNMLDEEGVKQAVISAEIEILNISYFLIITFCLISVSSFIPSMLEKGNIDLLLSKPVSRSKIIIAKFTGSVLLIFISLVYLIGFVWLILSIKSGYWHFPFLLSIFWLTLSFAVVFSFTLLVGLISQSSILSVLLSIFLLIVTKILSIREVAIFSFVENEPVRFIINFFYYILPKPSDINSIAENIIKQLPVESYMPVISSVLFMLAALSVSIIYFKKKDY
ncbi:MAG: ABC transporter permease subunit [Ignavibacteria bacterium]